MLVLLCHFKGAAFYGSILPRRSPDLTADTQHFSGTRRSLDGEPEGQKGDVVRGITLEVRNSPGNRKAAKLFSHGT
jgi:hypothetical protein